MVVRYHEFMHRLERYVTKDLPRYDQLLQTKAMILADQSRQLGVGELRSKVLTSFVRNRLIDTVYLR